MKNNHYRLLVLTSALGVGYTLVLINALHNNIITLPEWGFIITGFLVLVALTYWTAIEFQIADIVK